MRALPFFALLLSLAACNSTKNPITPKGTSLFAWDPSKATHEGFSAATIGSKTTKDFTVTVRPQGSIPFTLDLHVVTAPVDFVETGKSGLTFEAGDDCALADRLRSLEQDRSLLTRLQAGALERVKAYTPQRLGLAFEEFLGEICQEHTTRAAQRQAG